MVSSYANSIGRPRGALGRLRNLLQGWLTVWVRDREQAHPRAVYEQAISQRLRRYAELKDAVAGILFLRNKLEGEILERRGELLRAAADVQRALRRGDEPVALALVRHKQDLAGELERAERDLGALRGEAESAKENLLRFREEIRSLEREKGRALAVWAGAQARRQVHAVLEGLSVEADLRALEGLREHIAKLATEGQLDAEIGAAGPAGDGLGARLRAIRDEARDEAARSELDEIRRRLQPTLSADVPLTAEEVAREPAAQGADE
jgi:phage shock protein A